MEYMHNWGLSPIAHFCIKMFCLVYKIGIFAVTKTESMYNLSVITFIVDVVVVGPAR